MRCPAISVGTLSNTNCDIGMSIIFTAYMCQVIAKAGYAALEKPGNPYIGTAVFGNPALVLSTERTTGS